MSSIVENKNLYKVFLILIKYTPMLLAMTKLGSLITNYLKIRVFALTCIGGTSIIFLVLMYIISYVFKFCLTHRLPLHYTAITSGLTIADYYIGLPLQANSLCHMYVIVTGVFMLLWIIVWFVNRKNPKIDHIKQLCESYVSCCA
jgi:hypothetical protein